MSSSLTKRSVEEEEEVEEEEDDHTVKKKKVTETKSVVSKAPSGTGGNGSVFELGKLVACQLVATADLLHGIYIFRWQSQGHSCTFQEQFVHQHS